VEFLVCCVFAYWLVRHPEVIGEAAQAWAYGRRGEESPAAAARRMRLQDAGIDPASGGAFRQFAGNLWRDFWCDQDAARSRRRGERPGLPGAGQPRLGLLGRLLSAFDDEVERRAQAWKSRDAETPPDPRFADHPEQGDPGGEPDEPTAAEGESEGQPDPAPIRVPSTVGDPVGVTTTVGRPANNPQPGAIAVLEPPALPASPERTPNMTQALAPKGGAVTGMGSGAAEARAIQRYLENATQAYDAAMATARKRIHALGEQTVGVVQMSTKSTVVDLTAQAAESIASAQAGAHLCKAETIPLLGQVAREFDKRTS
jgi:hypothetical protein